MCAECEKIFTTKRRLNDHIKKKICENKNYKCSIRGYTLASEINLSFKNCLCVKTNFY